MASPTILELGALCLVGGVPGPSSCSISGSMPEGCSGTVALLPWRVEWVLAGSRWELDREWLLSWCMCGLYWARMVMVSHCCPMMRRACCSVALRRFMPLN